MLRANQHLIPESAGNSCLQDMRLYYFDTVEDSVVCNDEKLSAGSSASFVGSCKRFLNSTVFGKGAGWPSVVVAPSHLVDSDEDPNLAIEVSRAITPEDTHTISNYIVQMELGRFESD